MIAVGLVIAFVSFAIGFLYVMAAANHPTGGDSPGLVMLSIIGFVVGLVIAAVGAFV